MPRYAGFVQARETAPPQEKRGVRARHRQVGRLRAIALKRQREMIARLQRKAMRADDPANWFTLTGLSDEQKAAAIMGR